MKYYLILFSIIWSAAANADNVFIRYGLGSQNVMVPSIQEKILNVGYHGDLWNGLCWNVNGGFYSDSRRDLRSAFAALGLGPRVEPAPWFYLENYFGPAWVEKTDDLLGSNFQFAIDVGAGFMTPDNGVSIGISFKHLSNAGIKKPNRGRNFWTVEVGIPL